MMRIYSLDIGGSAVKHALVTVRAGVAEVAQRFAPIPLDGRAFDALRRQVVDAVRKQTESMTEALTIGISTSGAVERSGYVLSSGHFEGYEDVDWESILKQEFGEKVASVTTTNDGKASAWAEYQFCGGNSEVFAHFVIGTGVGGGLICFDRLLFGDDETAGALGHMKVGAPGGIICSCGREGCVETVASGPAIARHYARLLSVDASEAAGPDFDSTFTAALRGDERALRAFEVAGEWLGVAVSNVINVLNPRHISLGGGVLDASSQLGPKPGGPYLQATIRRAHSLAFEDIAEATRIEPAHAGNDGGLLGAALLAARREAGIDDHRGRVS